MRRVGGAGLNSNAMSAADDAEHVNLPTEVVISCGCRYESLRGTVHIFLNCFIVFESNLFYLYCKTQVLVVTYKYL